MKYLHYAFLLVFSIAFTLLTLVLSPVLPLFANNNGWLPWALSWFSTSDNSLDGDIGYQTEHAPFLGPQTGFKRYLNRVVWILRNPAYGFETSGFMGANISPSDQVLTTGNPFIKNRNQAVAGSYYCEIGEYWNYKLVTKPFYDGQTCFMLELGWKLQPYAQSVEALKTQPVAQFVCSPRITAFLP